MSETITAPFPIFFDRSGAPLDAGYIYIGTVGINPEVSPITVYWDASFTSTAAQPIRTLAGYASRNGSPGKLVIVQSGYSILVRDKNGALVYSDFNAVNSDYVETMDSIATLRALQGAAATQYLLGYNHTSGDGGGVFRLDSADTSSADNGGTIVVDAAGRRWKRQYQGAVHSDWFYTPHLTTVQTTALQAFLNAGPDLFVDPGTCVSGPVTIPANVAISGTRDAILKFDRTTAGKHIEVLGDGVIIAGITVDGSYTTETFAGGYTSGHFGIYAVGTSGANFNDLTCHDLLVKNYGDTGIYTKFVNNKAVTSCEITRCGYAGAQGLSTDGALFVNNYVHNIFPGDGSQNCYGITETSQKSPFERVAQKIILQSNRIDNVVPWAGLDLHFAKHCVVDGNIVSSCAQGIAYEGEFGTTPPPSTSDDVIISNNAILGWSGASTTRDGQTYYKTFGIGCKGADLNYQGTSLTIVGNNITGMGDTRAGGGGAGAIYFASWDGVVCTNNILRDNYVRGISASAGSAPITKLDCSHNTIINVTQDPTTFVCRGIEFYDVDGSGANNLITGLASGTEKYYQASLTRRFKFIQPKETLLENTTYYVRSGGSNSNIGTVNSTGGAFLTVQGAIDHIAANVNTNGKTVTIQINAGTWTTPIIAKSFEGDGTIIIIGDETTPANVVISTTSADCFRAENVQGIYSVRGVRLQTTTAGVGIFALGPSTYVEFQKCDFGSLAAGEHQIASYFGARVYATGNYSISGSAGTHLNTQHGEIDVRNVTVTLTGTPNYTTAFAQCARTGHLAVSGMTFSGSATGVYYSAISNGVIFTNGAGGTYLPGNSAGSTATGGQYV